MAHIFHIATREVWSNSAAKGAAGKYQPEAFPIDGFIHCSTREQVIQVANTRFRGQSGLVLLSIDPDLLQAEVVYENLEGGEQLFPHIYGELNPAAVVQVSNFEPGKDGTFTLPDLDDN
jgi:uncharacterized protein (DUF952 family)